ncbi:hypothetical protein U1Q18_050727 [Sarracenia purpurea var. burkii]
MAARLVRIDVFIYEYTRVRDGYMQNEPEHGILHRIHHGCKFNSVYSTYKFAVFRYPLACGFDILVGWPELAYTRSSVYRANKYGISFTSRLYKFNAICIV